MRFIKHKPTKKKVVELIDKLKEYKRASYYGGEKGELKEC